MLATCESWIYGYKPSHIEGNQVAFVSLPTVDKATNSSHAKGKQKCVTINESKNKMHSNNDGLKGNTTPG